LLPYWRFWFFYVSPARTVLSARGIVSELNARSSISSRIAVEQTFFDRIGFVVV